MNTATNTFQLEIPQSDNGFVRQLAKRMGWVIKNVTTNEQQKNGLDLAIEDIEEGRVYNAKDVDDMFKQILG